MPKKIVKDKRKTLNKKTQSLLSSSSAGFSLLEILIALFIVVLITYAASGSGSLFGKNSMDEALDGLERAVRFSANETILQGAIVRIKLSLTTTPVTYSVEYGPKDGFILPQFSDFKAKQDLNIRELEDYQKVEKKVNTQFNAVNEFADSPLELPESIRILGVASSLRTNVLLTEEDAYIYFYPNGEKDDTLIILTDESEFASLEIEPFRDKISKQFYDIRELLESPTFEDDLFAKAKEVYENWSK